MNIGVKIRITFRYAAVSSKETVSSQRSTAILSPKKMPTRARAMPIASPAATAVENAVSEASRRCIVRLT